MFESDDFRGRPYGFTTNQISHAAAIGFLLIVYGLTLFWVWLYGEYPFKWMIALVGGLGYFAYELWDQGWQGADTIEDWWFVNVYGVWAPLVALSEASPEVVKIVGAYAFTGDLFAALPYMVLFAIHLALGALWRWAQS